MKCSEECLDFVEFLHNFGYLSRLHSVSKWIFCYNDKRIFEVRKLAFTVTINQFEGPLDLMLHLIKDNKLDLFDLDMNILTNNCNI